MIQPPPALSSKGIGAASLTLAGIMAAFGVATCCGLPILFASAGISAAWLGGIGIATAPWRTPLLVVGAFCLLAGAVLLLRQQIVATRCGPNDACTPHWARALILSELLIGAALLWLGWHYV